MEKQEPVDNALPLPMFPLSSVLFPTTGVPLHIFEPRYIRLMDDLSNAPPHFGVVLITRGGEVGGANQRTDLGTMARITEKALVGDGRWLIFAIGEKRIRVRNWLPDDPYPLALVEEVVDEPFDGDPFERFKELEKKLRYSLLLQGEISLTKSISPNIGLSRDPQEALWQMCALAPVSIMDQQSLLATLDATRRADLLDQLLIEATTVLEAQLSL
ncbi:MAG: hypothetical protein HKL84_01950 [Acidimicrobiaceae bacterium]|nr:hypothetical protein [Acidimicrobiaceae bacterium]